MRGLVAAAVLLALGGCRDGRAGGGVDGTETDGGTGDGSGSEGSESGDPAQPPPDFVPLAGMRRLSRHEYDNTVADLLGDDTQPSALLPEDVVAPFDNDYTEQVASQPLVEALDALAADIAQRLVADAPRRDQVVGCTPAGPTDEACLRTFVTDFGRRALRRRLPDAEVDAYIELAREFGDRTGDFYAGVEVVVRAFLQDADFVYRIEVGEPVEDEPGTFRLDDYEIATRMSYLLWGSTPNDWLLDAAEAGELVDPDGRVEIAALMFDDSRALGQIDRFHALWLGYSQLPHAADLTTAMREETKALLRRVVLEEQRSWLDLFTADETWLNATLADHYGLPAPGGWDWVPYGASGRQGLLSHGTFLSVAANPGDTSPTKRGKHIRELLMCETIPAPPPEVPADEPPDPSTSNCKEDQYAAHRENPTCAACHAQMDPIGFGLENYDLAGRYREHDEGFAECTISGDGELAGVGKFNGPAELADLLVEADVLDDCAVRQLYRYAMGRAPDGNDDALIETLAERFADQDHRFDGLLLELVGDPAFAFRREE